jgi:hypothetical protein
MIGDIAPIARAKLAALPELYAAVQVPPDDPGRAAKQLLCIESDQYERLHSRFRAALETELTQKPHEAVSFIIRELFEPPGLLVNEELLAIRLGIDKARSGGWERLKEHFAPARYVGVGCNGFHRWWMDLVLSRWTQPGSPALFRLSAVERVATLNKAGFGDLVALMPTPESPGDRPWFLSISDDPALRLPVDPRHAFILSSPVSPWLDEPVWCLEQAKRNRRSPSLSQDARDRLRVALRVSSDEPPAS